MHIDTGEIRFLTKVAEKSPRGLRLLLFKQKISGLEKLVFIVKTASQDIDKLAISKMTWQVEQSKLAARVVVARMLILPEGSKEFFKSETGLLMNDDKDRRSLQALATQKSVEIYFFNFENEFHSKIELLTTYNMSKSAQLLMDANPIIDESKMIVKSENLSENDIKNAMSGNVNATPLKDRDLADSIQKKMPSVSNVSPKTKIEEYTKTSIKTNDIAASGNFGNTIPPQNKKSDLGVNDLKKSNSIPPGKITPEELLKSIPPNKLFTNDIIAKTSTKTDLNSINAEDLLKVVDSIPPGKITPEELLKSLPPTNKINVNDFLSNSITPDLSSVKAEDLLKIVDSIPPGKITPEDLLKSLPPNKINASEFFADNAILTPEELMTSLKESMPSQGSIKASDLLRSTAKPGTTISDLLDQKIPADVLDQMNLADVLNKNDPSGFFQDIAKPKPKNEPKIVIDNTTREMKKDDLLDALMSEQSPLKLTEEEDKSLLTDLMSEPTPLKSSEGDSELAKNLEVNIKNVKVLNNTQHGVTKKEDSLGVSISADDLLKALNGDM